jgi:hypothetical protein
MRRGWLPVVSLLLAVSPCGANDLGEPFFVTYTSHLEEPRELEIEARSITGKPAGGNRFGATALEFEYGATSWWTTELYLDGQATGRESTIFTGYRWENRFRLLRRQHWINPVLYCEFENVNGADKPLLEVTGHDTFADFAIPNHIARLEKNRELENKLILSSYFKGWTVSENIIAEKNFSNQPWAFGYAAGVSHPLARQTGGADCAFCARAFQAGVEAYGGVGTYTNFGLHDTSHYIGPVLTWSAHATTLKVSPNFGLSGPSARFLLRFGVAYEVEGFGKAVKGLFRK